jgi:hypothetical protein
MALTRRLYDFAEVRAAFLFCLKHRRILEGVFWLQELEDSLYGGEARRLLFISWCMNVGLRRIAWLAEWSAKSTTREGRLELCWKLMRCPEKDSSIWWLLWCGLVCSAPTGALARRWKAVAHSADATEFWEPIVNQSEDERVDSILEALQEDMRGYSILARCTGLALVTTLTKLPKSTWAEIGPEEPKGLQETLQLWVYAEKKSVRERRIYEIPYDCLFGMTWRGAGGDTSAELRELGLTGFTASPYWKRMIAEFVDQGDADCWKSDDALEEFWNTHFGVICDIPDEWSLTAREKSHGTGCPVGPMTRWWSRWIGSERLFIYGADQWAVVEWMRGQKTEATSVLDRLLQLYKDTSVVYIKPAHAKKVWSFA